MFVRKKPTVCLFISLLFPSDCSVNYLRICQDRHAVARWSVKSLHPHNRVYSPPEPLQEPFKIGKEVATRLQCQLKGWTVLDVVRNYLLFEAALPFLGLAFIQLQHADILHLQTWRERGESCAKLLIRQPTRDHYWERCHCRSACYKVREHTNIYQQVGPPHIQETGPCTHKSFYLHYISACSFPLPHVATARKKSKNNTFAAQLFITQPIIESSLVDSLPQLQPQ